MNRYPGIQPFGNDQSHLFKGREAEKRELLNLVILHPLVVLFAKSGIGKTSLLQAGISPQMPEHKLMPVFVRLNLTEFSPEAQVREALIQEGVLSNEIPDDLTMWQYLKKARFVQHGKPCTPVLIFDQFEELFTLYDATQREGFVRQFADVINRRMPDHLRQNLDNELDTLTPLQIAQRESSLNVKVVLSIRSDMLSFLDQLSRPIPSILRCRYELKSLSRANAEKAIVLPAAAEGEFDTPTFAYSDFALQEILNFLQSRDTDTDDATAIDSRLIESFQLQLLCSRIEDKLPEKDSSKNIVIHTDDYGHQEGLQHIINDFYHNTIQSFSPQRRLNIQRAIEEDLIRNERRISMAASVLKDWNITDSELQDLVNKRLLRKDIRLGGAYYEVSHDTLVKPILESYTLRKAKEFRRKILVGIGIGLLFIGVAALITVWALNQRNIALDAKNEAQNARIEAEKAREKAIDEKNRADSLRIIAETEKQRALIALNEKDLKEQQRQQEERRRKTIEIQSIVEKARAYKQNGDFDIAIEELNKALKIDNNLQSVKQLIKECQDEIDKK